MSDAILYLHESSEVGGAEGSLLILAEALDRARFTPVFAIPRRGSFSELLEGAALETVFIDLPRLRGLAGVVSAVRELLHLVRAKNIRLIHSNSIRSHLYGACVARMAGIPVVWHQRNLLVGEKFDPDRALAFIPDLIVCNSRAIARRFLRGKKLPGKVKVVLTGVDTSRFSPQVDGAGVRGEFGIGADERVVGIASRFNAQKGHECFFEAARLLTAMPGGERLRFLVAGGAVFAEDRAREEEVRRDAARAGLEGKVVFTGFRTDMPSVYAAMDICVLPSSAEACGRVVLEAMASGKPLVATRTGGTPEMVVDGVDGLLVDPADPVALADRIIFLAGHPAEAARIGAAARARAVDRFDIGVHAKVIQELYRMLRVGDGQ